MLPRSDEIICKLAPKTSPSEQESYTKPRKSGNLELPLEPKLPPGRLRYPAEVRGGQNPYPVLFHGLHAEAVHL